MSQTHAGWRAYHQGDYRKALELFDAADDWPNALAGLALSILALGQGSDALLLVEQNARERRDTEVNVLLADLTGRTGDRAGAERILNKIIEAAPDHALARSLLAEQCIRQGRWDHGTETFIDALASADPRASLHLKRVILDLIDAVAARRIPQAEAMRFINRVDYSIPNKDPSFNQFFGSARRAVNAQQRIDDIARTEPWSYSEGSARVIAPSVASPASARPPAVSARPAPGNAPAPAAADSSPPRAPKISQRPAPAQRSPAPEAPRASGARARERRAEAKLRRQAIADERSDLMDSGLTTMSRALRQERDANETLQQDVPEARPPAWPSEVQEPIDTIKPISSMAGSAVYGRNHTIRTGTFKLTSGDIRVEITLERCMHNMLASIQSIGDVTVHFNLQALRQLELNLLDDIFASMPELSALYRDETAVDDQRSLALGKFLGDCIAQAFGGVWDYSQPPRSSTMSVGQQQLDPMGVAYKIIEADHFDAIGFEQLIRQAEVGSNTSTAIIARHFFVDPTPGLEGEALHMMLAELWVAYRYVLGAILINDVANTLKAHSIHDDFIVFTMDRQFVPEAFVAQAGPGAFSNEERAALAYVRHTGEFLLLGSARHFGRFLEITGFQLSESSLSSLLPWLQRLFRPGWRLVESEEIARRAVERTGMNAIREPRINRLGQKTVLHLNFLDRTAAHRLSLSHDPDALAPYEVTLAPLS